MREQKGMGEVVVGKRLTVLKTRLGRNKERKRESGG